MQNGALAIPAKVVRASQVRPINHARSAPVVGLDYGRWIEHFAQNRLLRPEPAWAAPVVVSREAWAPLLRSLE